jgi:hypothetical protein
MSLPLALLVAAGVTVDMLLPEALVASGVPVPLVAPAELVASGVPVVIPLELLPVTGRFTTTPVTVPTG